MKAMVAGLAIMMFTDATVNRSMPISRDSDVKHRPISDKIFLQAGVELYREANVAFRKRNISPHARPERCTPPSLRAEGLVCSHTSADLCVDEASEAPLR